MKVLLHTAAFWPIVGGVETFVAGLAGYLHRTGIEVVVAAENSFSGDSPFPFPVYWSPDAETVRRLLLECDVLHMNVMNISLHLRALRYGKKVVMTYHDVTPICPKGFKMRPNGPCNRGGPVTCLLCMKRSGTPHPLKFLIRPLVKSVLSVFLHANIVDSGWALRKFPLARKRCIPLFVDSSQFSPATSPQTGRANQRLRVVFAGRLVESKGPQILVEALRLCCERGAGFDLILCGSGTFEESLRELIDRSGLREFVDMRGFLDPPQLADVYRGADLAVVPSICYETFGFAAAEAMASGVPVIVTDAGGTEYAVGDAGLVVERGDAEALADAIQLLAKDPVRRERMARAGRLRTTGSFDEVHTVQRYAELYQTLVANPARLSILS